MLQLKPSCEHCDKDLPYNSKDAQVCTFECTYCTNCALEVFKNVCPNCGGGFSPRPIRPSHLLEKYPASTERIYKPKTASQIEDCVFRAREINSDSQ